MDYRQAGLKNYLRSNSFLQPVVNPFVHNLKLNFSQKAQMLLIAVTLLPLRVISCMIMLILTWFLGKVATIGLDVSMKEPASQVRCILFMIIRLMGRICLFCLGFHRIQVRGKRATSSEAPILVIAPHSSLFDVFVSFVSNPLPSSFSRIENYHIPLIGSLLIATQPIFVNRHDQNSRGNSINELKRRVSTPGKWPQIIVFPEGTCTNRKCFIMFKSGAFIPGTAVQPVVIEYLNELDSYTWTMKGPGTWDVIWMSLCQLSIKTRVTYLPVYKPSQDEKNNPKLFANNVRMVMADYLHIPCTDHTFDDCRLMRHAESLNLPMESGLVEFAKISRKLGMDLNSVQNKLEEFSKIACKHGVISIENFAKFLNLPISPALKEMFKLYDRNDSGKIDFREYVIGLSLIAKPAVTNDTVKLAFKVFDKDGNGMISEVEFDQVLCATFGDEFQSGKIFKEINKSCPDKVTFEEFHDFVNTRPEYAKVFVWYKEMMEDDSIMKNLSTKNSEVVDANSENNKKTD